MNQNPPVESTWMDLHALPALLKLLSLGELRIIILQPIILYLLQSLNQKDF